MSRAKKSVGLTVIPMVAPFRDAYQELRRSAIAWQEVIRDRPDREELQRAHDVVFKRLTEESAARVTQGLQSKKEFRPLARPSGKMMGKQKQKEIKS